MLADAITIHKSQGSDYLAVVIPLTTQHLVTLERNLLFTGVNWSMVLVGQRSVLAIAGRIGIRRGRWSKLRERLEPEGGSPGWT